MSMIAVYQEITDKELEELATCDDLYDRLEVYEEDNELSFCDIDEMWDSLHFLLTGQSAGVVLEGNLLSEAITGVKSLDIENYVACLPSERVKEIANFMKDLDFKDYKAGFDLEDFKENDIYPGRWDKMEDGSAILQGLEDSFEMLKSFYLKMSDKNSAVLVSIF